MSIYAFHENAPAVSSLDGTEIVPLLQSGVVKQHTTAGALSLAPVNTTATTLTITQAAHGNRVVTVSSAAPIAITLPQATGTGTKYTFQMQVAATGTASTIKVANATDVMQGVAWFQTTTSDAVVAFKATATDDTVSVNGTTKGGVVGDIIEITDVKTGFFSVKMFASPTGSHATPFSATV